MPQYTELVAWLTQEMKSFIGLEEHVNPITSKSVLFFLCILKHCHRKEPYYKSIVKPFCTIQFFTTILQLHTLK